MPIYFGLAPHELPLTAESIGNQWEQDTVRRPNGYPHYHWLQTQKGVGEVIIENKRLPLPKDTGIMIAPFVPHIYYPKETGWITSFVTFSGKLKTEIDKIIGHERYILAEENADFSFHGWVEKIIDAHITQQINPIHLSVDCYTFLMNIHRLRKELDFLTHPLYQCYVLPVIKTIETNYEQEINIRELAESVYISQQYLARLFQRFLGCSPHLYLTNYRMNKAKELLASCPDLKIQQVSFQVGYPDVSYFISVFKKSTDCTPLEFRNLHH